MNDPLFKNAIPNGTAYCPQSPGIVLIRFDPTVAVYIPGCDSGSIEFCEHDAQLFPVGVAVEFFL